jgi:hypothetical protein
MRAFHPPGATGKIATLIRNFGEKKIKRSGESSAGALMVLREAILKMAAR